MSTQRQNEPATATASLRYEDQELTASPGERLLDVILRAGIDHRHICGGYGFCTSCRVEVLDGAEHLSPVSPLEVERLGADAGKLRLACQTRILGNVHVRVPEAGKGRFSLSSLEAEE